MNGWVRRTLILGLLILFFGSGWFALRQLRDYRVAGYGQEQARQTAGLAEQSGEMNASPQPVLPTEPIEVPPVQPPLEERAQHLLTVDLDELRLTNPDVRGWICIPGTQLDYPILQAEDNQYYLNYTWQKKRNAAGSVFLECKANPDFSDFNTILYGHNMKNGSIFGSLRQYRTQSHYQKNPCIYIVNDSGVHRYEIFSAFEAEVWGYTYRLDINTPEKKQAFLEYSAGRNMLQTAVTPTVEDRVITLSTCTGNGYDHRWVVQGVLTGTFTQPEHSVPAAEH